MTPVNEGVYGLVVEGADMSVDEVEVEDDVKVVKVLILELDAEMVNALVLVLELDAVAGPVGKDVCAEAVDEVVDEGMVVDAAINRVKV